MSAELRVEQLRKVFVTGHPPVQKAAIDTVSFTIAAGEIVVLLGPSGCGKTTTLRCVAGLEHPNSGRIVIGGTAYTDPAAGVLVPPRSRNLGMVFQSYAVWPHMTVRQNVTYPLRARKTPRADQARAVQEALALVELAEYADRPVTQLSGGQMQRVALARSMVYHPQILLLDEPLSNLDAQLRLRLRDDLRRIIKRAGLTALYVTHDQTEAVVLGDRIGVMRDGRLLQLDTPREIYNRPADLFVAGFTGATNRIDGRLLRHDADFAIIETRSGERLLARLGSGLQDGAAARVALRPDNVVFAPAGDGPNRFTAHVESQHYQGTQTVYEVTVLGTRIEALEVGSSARWEVGAEVTVALPPEMCWGYGP
ncbi:MAG: ABC transporter ATP-binding protein [Acetobacteraceae bacterium]|nr:ABC transporter ATP-binding protein [Acetobacteraceae bacterium]